ncbi:MAG: ATPase, T2SS/T4P/T4SS family [Methanobacteriota archaeon]
MEAKIIVPDTSVLVDGRITEVLGEYTKDSELEIIIPNAVVAELEAQANDGKETGFDGLLELQRLQELKLELKFIVNFSGEHPKPSDLLHAGTGRVDHLIRNVAEEKNALFVTSDRVQAQVAESRGLAVRFIEPKTRDKEPSVFSLFDGKTMSLHLKENTCVYAKKGSVGSVKLEKISEKISRSILEEKVKEVCECAHRDPCGYVELEEKGATVIQLREYRIVITRSPFSDGLEMTIVKPLVKTKLSDYSLSGKLVDRLDSHAEGVFVAGPPGAGKTTFVQALAEHYRRKGKIIKTMEHPRDLQVHEDITQYGPLDGSMEKTGDLLLLVRPDYTIYDELRKTSDFKVFSDMRLAGVGLVGVTHASKAIDAIQRLVGRVELGVIPHVVDTLIFIRAGFVESVYELSMTVKVPHGMTESDLARPVIQVRDFESGKPEFELYSFGEEVAVIPISEVKAGTPRGRRRRQDRVYSTKKQIVVHEPALRNTTVRISIDGEYITSGHVNAGGNLKLKRTTHAAKRIVAAIQEGKEVELE